MSGLYFDPVISQQSDPTIHTDIISSRMGVARSNKYSSFNVNQTSQMMTCKTNGDIILANLFNTADTKFSLNLNPSTVIHTLNKLYLRFSYSNGTGGAVTTLPTEFAVKKFVHYPNGEASNNELYSTEAYIMNNLTHTVRENYYKGQVTFTDNDPSAAATTAAMFTSSTSIANGATGTFWYPVPDPYSAGSVPLFLLQQDHTPKLEFTINEAFQDTGGDLTCTAVDVFYFGVTYAPSVLAQLKMLYSKYPLVLRTLVVKRNTEIVNWTANTESSVYNLFNVDGKCAFLIIYTRPTAAAGLNQITNGAAGLLQLSSFSLKFDNQVYWNYQNFPEDLVQKIFPYQQEFPGLFAGSRRFYILPFTRNPAETLRLHLDRGSARINNQCTLTVTPAATTANCTLFYVAINYAALVIAGGVCSLIEKM